MHSTNAGLKFWPPKATVLAFSQTDAEQLCVCVCVCVCACACVIGEEAAVWKPAVCQRASPPRMIRRSQGRPSPRRRAAGWFHSACLIFGTNWMVGVVKVMAQDVMDMSLDTILRRLVFLWK